MEQKVPLAFAAFLALLAGLSNAHKSVACPAAGAAVLDTPGRLLLQTKQQRSQAGLQPGESEVQKNAEEGQQSVLEREKKPEEAAAEEKERLMKELGELKKAAAKPEKEKGSLKKTPEVAAAEELADERDRRTPDPVDPDGFSPEGQLRLMKEAAEKRDRQMKAKDPFEKKEKERLMKELAELKKEAAEPEEEEGELNKAPEVARELEEEKKSSKKASEAVAAEPATEATQAKADQIEERLRQARERMKKELKELRELKKAPKESEKVEAEPGDEKGTLKEAPEEVAAEPEEEEEEEAIEASEEKPGKSHSKKDCKLPKGAVWCEARLQHLSPFRIATYAKGDVVSLSICDLGHWEESNFAAFGPPGNMLDAGAHIGYHTFGFAKSGWNVTAFEPMATNLELMEATLCRNPDVRDRIRINRFGLGAKTEKCEMVVPAINVGDGFMRCADAKKNALPLREEDQPVSVGEFDVRRLDEVLQEQEITRVDLVKVDVEGYEAQVFAGAPDFLRQFRPKLIKSEAWWKLVGPADGNGTTGVEYFDMFKQAGYKFFQDNACQIPFDPVEALDRGSVDVIMCLALDTV